MNNQIRRLTIVIMIMFLSLMAASTLIQFFFAPTYMADARNQRAVYAAAARDRGPILVKGEAIAKSEPSQDSFRYQRVYTNPEMYSLITGYQMVAVSAPSTGLERNQNEVLTGTAPSLLTSRLKQLFTGAQVRGGALELTINPDMQREAWDKLGDRKGAVVVLDAKTGAILALVSKPGYDPNLLASHNPQEVLEADRALQEDPSRPLDNRAFGGHLYPPGSVFKLVTTAALLENTDLNADSEVDAPREISLPQTSAKLHNYAHEACGDGKVPLKEAIARSCNTPFALQAMEVGASALKNAAEDFGYDQELSIPLEVSPSQFPKIESKAQLAQTSIGQYSLQVSPLQVAMTTQAIANDGVQMKPYLIQEILDGELKVQDTTEPQMLRTAVPKEVAQQLQTMMREVVTAPYGLGHGSALESLQAAGKTGTAELGNTGSTIAWFTGYAPYDNPQLVIAVALEGDSSWVKDPTGGKYAIPVAADVLKVGLGK